MTDLLNSRLYQLYRTMRRIRSFEERVAELYTKGQTAGSMLHLSIGEEGAAAGVCDALQQEDNFTTHHRGHGIFLARGADPNRMMAEVAGKQSGYCHGKGGSMHIADIALGHLGANAVVGGGISAAVGAGLSHKRLGRRAVAVAFFGDGALGQGILYESMNIAALWGLPVLFVCINNQYGMGTRVDHATKFLGFDERARTFGLRAAMVDGEDVEAVRDAAEDLVIGARRGEPGFLAISCYRFYGHGRMDKSPYRSPEEEQQGRHRDPVLRARAALIDQHLNSQTQIDELDVQILAEMDRAIEFAVAAAPPPIDSIFKDVYADNQPTPESVRARIDRVLARQ